MMRTIRVEQLRKDENGNIDCKPCAFIKNNMRVLLEADCLEENQTDDLNYLGAFYNPYGVSHIIVVHSDNKLLPFHTHWLDKPLLKTESNVVQLFDNPVEL